MESGIYKIKNIVNGKIYIGSAKSIKKRWGQHISALNKNSHDNIYLQKAWNKYGEGNFEFTIVEEVELNDLIIMEQHYIDLYNVCNRSIGYNLLPTAGNLLGYKHSDESKRKMSDSQKGKILTSETKEKISAGHKGIKYNTCRKGWKGTKASDETKKKMSESRIGRKLSYETKQKISKSNLGKKQSEETKLKISKGLIGNKNGLGRIVTDETRKNISKTHIGLNRGEKNGRGMAITNKFEVISIRNDYNNGTSISNLALKYNRKYMLIYNIVKNISWKWVN